MKSVRMISFQTPNLGKYQRIPRNIFEEATYSTEANIIHAINTLSIGTLSNGLGCNGEINCVRTRVNEIERKLGNQ